ncbi:MAG: hypothetical protein Q7R54_02080 [bacterium]|nr:hypothetical protein [bacterium]
MDRKPLPAERSWPVPVLIVAFLIITCIIALALGERRPSSSSATVSPASQNIGE